MTRSALFDLAATAARLEFTPEPKPEPVAFYSGCPECAGQCKGHPVKTGERMEALVESARWAVETVCRAALAKDQQSDQLVAENRAMYEVLTRIATGFENTDPRTMAGWAADCLDAVSGAK